MTTHLITTLAVAVGVYLIRRANARHSTKDWFIGWVVFSLIVGSYAAAGFLHCLLVNNKFLDVFGMASMAATFGLFAGLVIGHWVWKYYRKEIESEDNLQ